MTVMYFCYEIETIDNLQVKSLKLLTFDKDKATMWSNEPTELLTTRFYIRKDFKLF